MQFNESFQRLKQIGINERQMKQHQAAEIRKQMYEDVEQRIAARLANSALPGADDIDMEDQEDAVCKLVENALGQRKTNIQCPFKICRALIAKLCFEGIVIDEEGKPNYNEVLFQVQQHPEPETWTYNFRNYMAYKPRQ